MNTQWPPSKARSITPKSVATEEAGDAGANGCSQIGMTKVRLDNGVDGHKGLEDSKGVAAEE